MEQADNLIELDVDFEALENIRLYAAIKHYFNRFVSDMDRIPLSFDEEFDLGYVPEDYMGAGW